MKASIDLAFERSLSVDTSGAPGSKRLLKSLVP